MKLFICDSFLWQPVMFFWVRQGLEIKMLLLREVLSVYMHRQTHQRMDDGAIQFIVFVYKLNAPLIINCRK